MRNRSKIIVTHVTIIVIAFAAGWCAGVLYYPELFPPEEVTEADADAASDHDHEEVIVLAPPAVANLGLSIGHVTEDDYWQLETFPGEVVEIPGRSDLSVSAPVSGVIERVWVRVGESVAGGDALFELRITDQDLVTAQFDLLTIVSRLGVATSEISRLAPLVAEGSVPGKRTRDLEYEVATLEAQRDTKSQEILARGLPAYMMDQILETKQLATHIPIAVPVFESSEDSASAEPPTALTTGDLTYAIGAIHCHPGMAVIAGADLCDLSYHAKLYIKGQAFESELPIITSLSDASWRASAEFGHHHDAGHEHTTIRRRLQVTHVDNHVDPETQTFSFYLPLENEVVQDVETNGRLYRQWRFKPGQRAHLRIPVAKHTSQMVLPIQALAIEGPNVFAFRVHEHHVDPDHDHPDNEVDVGDDLHDEDVELEPVQVQILYRDDKFAVVAADGELRVGDEVAMNCGFQLRLAMRADAGGGGHDHEH